MYRIRLSTLRTKTCAALNGTAESTVPDTLAVPAIPAVCGGGGAAAHMLTPKNIDAATKLVINLPIYPSYFARGFGRVWNFTIFWSEPLPPSWCQGVYME